MKCFIRCSGELQLRWSPVCIFKVRIFAFGDGLGTQNALQPFPGQYNEKTFRGLDYVLMKAGEMGVMLMPSLVNNWPAWGGKQAYVAWSPTASEENQFFSDQVCKQLFMNNVRAVLERINTYTGIAYKVRHLLVQ